MKIALLIEGQGDRDAFPCLVSRIGEKLGSFLIAPNPIMTKGYENLKRDGQLERFLMLAASSKDVEHIVISVDLDDGCAVHCRREFEQRCKALSDHITIPIHIAFCVREYECWFLEDIENLRKSIPDYDWIDGFECLNPHDKRDAKGLLNSAMKRHYKPSTDQLKLTRQLDLSSLYKKSRSFRRLARAVSGLDYDLLEDAFGG